jgi:hypothetical protein
MARVNQARQDAEWVLANVLEPTTPLERMALKGAKVAPRQLKNLAKYRAKNIDRLRAQNRAYLAKKHGRPQPRPLNDGKRPKKPAGRRKLSAVAPTGSEAGHVLR